MMVTKRVDAPAGRHYTAQSAQDCVGASQVVLLWTYGVVIGRVAAVALVNGGESVLLRIEYERPASVVVPDDVCARMESCRWDAHCPFFGTCARHVHGPDCGGCQ